MSGITRFLGDSPLRVAIKLIVVSFLVGIVIATFGWSPWDVIYRVESLFVGLWNLGFEALHGFWGYFLLGAAVVIPAFIILRVVSYRR
jgi:hypothetical protein